MVEALVAEAQAIMEEGIEARIAKAEVGAQAESEAVREELLQIQGVDANKSSIKIDKIENLVNE